VASSLGGGSEVIHQPWHLPCHVPKEDEIVKCSSPPVELRERVSSIGLLEATPPLDSHWFSDDPKSDPKIEVNTCYGRHGAGSSVDAGRGGGNEKRKGLSRGSQLRLLRWVGLVGRFC
jgi:hypothetical protein